MNSILRLEYNSLRLVFDEFKNKTLLCKRYFSLRPPFSSPNPRQSTNCFESFMLILMLRLKPEWMSPRLFSLKKTGVASEVMGNLALKT